MRMWRVPSVWNNEGIRRSTTTAAAAAAIPLLLALVALRGVTFPGSSSSASDIQSQCGEGGTHIYRGGFSVCLILVLSRDTNLMSHSFSTDDDYDSPLQSFVIFCASHQSRVNPSFHLFPTHRVECGPGDVDWVPVRAAWAVEGGVVGGMTGSGGGGGDSEGAELAGAQLCPHVQLVLAGKASIRKSHFSKPAFNNPLCFTSPVATTTVGGTV